MSETEQMLRRALMWALSVTSSDGIIKHIAPLHFAASGKVKIGDRTADCPHLWWEGLGRRVTVSTSPAGRILHYVDAYDDHSMRLDMTLPRDFWVKEAGK